MTMHHEGTEEKSNTITVGSLVRAARRVVDPDAGEVWPDESILALVARGGGEAVAAEVGDLGRVLEHLSDDHVIVHFERAPCAVDVGLDDLAPFMTLYQGGIA